MTNNQLIIIGSLWMIIIFVVFGVWLSVLSRPSAADIASKSQPPEALPVIAAQQLSQQAVGREIKGSLPIDLGTAGLGRQDPFAGQ
jgi:hypothetical protein